MSKKNIHGLSRTVPPDVRYIIRKDSYFDCVHCGMALGDYEHIDPEWKDAKSHDPKNMTFLCPTQNQKKQRGNLSKEQVWEWKNNPWCKNQGHCHESFDVGNDSFAIWIGNTKIQDIEKIITIDDTCILSLKNPEENSMAFRLSAIFHDKDGNKILQIEDNEWRAESDQFDVISSNGKIGIKDQDGNIALKLGCFPRQAVVIEKVNMNYNGLIVTIDQEGCEIIGPNGGRVNIGNNRLFKAIDKTSSLFSFRSDKPGVTIGGVQIMSTDENAPTRKFQSIKCPTNSKCPCDSGEKYKYCHYPRYDWIL